MRRLILIFALVLLTGGGFSWWWFQPERVVARRVLALLDAATVEADDGNIHRGTRGDAISGFLAPNIEFDGPDDLEEDVSGPQSRSTVVSLYGALAKFCRRISLVDPQIESVVIDGDEARVRARVDAIIELPDDRSPVDGIQHMTLGWRKSDGKWLLESAGWSESGR
jgi:hypothetical protein